MYINKENIDKVCRSHEYFALTFDDWGLLKTFVDAVSKECDDWYRDPAHITIYKGPFKNIWIYLACDSKLYSPTSFEYVGDVSAFAHELRFPAANYINKDNVSKRTYRVNWY